MTDLRKVTLTIKVHTVLSVEELKTMQALVFGRMRSDTYAKAHRTTIKHEMPAGLNHDVRGTIEDVKVKVGGKVEASARASSPAKKANGKLAAATA